eukprot:snap_masked-scaffold_1-processed-gene-5.36-mRNA-1 protein AED:1.00 eAED:1.00 QI:0/0/0/0/1/1/2/0/67
MDEFGGRFSQINAHNNLKLRFYTLFLKNDRIGQTRKKVKLWAPDNNYLAKPYINIVLRGHVEVGVWY